VRRGEAKQEHASRVAESQDSGGAKIHVEELKWSLEIQGKGKGSPRHLVGGGGSGEGEVLKRRKGQRCDAPKEGEKGPSTKIKER